MAIGFGYLIFVIAAFMASIYYLIWLVIWILGSSSASHHCQNIRLPIMRNATNNLGSMKWDSFGSKNECRFMHNWHLPFLLKY
jgi:hypothetical protein